MYVYRIKNLNGFCSYCENLNTASLKNIIDENCEFGELFIGSYELKQLQLDNNVKVCDNKLYINEKII